MKIKGKVICTMMMLGFVLLFGGKVKAATVSNQADLKTAISGGDANIVIGNDFAITDNTIVIPATYNGTIDGNGKTLTYSASVTGASMFGLTTGSNVKFVNITLDAKDIGKALYLQGGSHVVLDEVVITNGLAPVTPHPTWGINRGAGIYMAAGASTLTMNDSTIQKCNSIENGGAIHSAAGTKTELNNSQILESTALNGGAIFVQDAEIILNDSQIEKCRAHNGTVIGQGGAIWAVDASVSLDNTDITINRMAEWPAGEKICSLGAGIYSVRTTVDISGGNFTIDSAGDAFVTQGGGVIYANNTKVNIEGANFKAIGSVSKVASGGGFIAMAGNDALYGIELNIKDSTFESSAQKLATFGGSIAIEANTKGIVNIEGCSFEGGRGELVGGAITLGTSTASSVDIKGMIKNTTFGHYRNDWGGLGGTIFLAKGSDFVMENVEFNGIGSSTANEGGAIYNNGKLEIKNVKIENVRAGVAGGGIYNANDGEIIFESGSISDCIVAGNASTSGKGGGIYNEGTLTIKGGTFKDNTAIIVSGSDEHAGDNIYCAADVTIYDAATFDSGDIRVWNNTSSILIPDARTKALQVSVIETSSAVETESREVGYLIAKGTGGYNITANDAKQITYKSQDTETTNDPAVMHKWYFYYVTNNTDTNYQNVVMSHNTAVSFIPNHADAEFTAGTPGLDGVTGYVTEKVNVYNILATNKSITKITAEPNRDGYTFVNWYNKAVTDAEVKADDTANVYNFAGAQVMAGTPVTTLIPEVKIYAGWRANPVSLSISKVLAGNDTDSTKSFEFTVTIAGAPYSGSYEIAGTTYNTTNGKISLTGGQTALIKNLTVEDSYVVTEADYSAEGYTTTSQNASGTLKGGITTTFTNTKDYVPKAAKIDLSVTKAITGDTPGSAETFEFVLSGLAGAPMPSGTIGNEKEITISGAGSQNFGEISYGTLGTYKYKVIETPGSSQGYTYDTTEYEVTVEVTWPVATGDYVATISYEVESAAKSEVKFTNTYHEAVKAEVTPSVSKSITGDIPRDNENFRFQLIAVGIAPMPTGSDIVTVTGTGSVNFGKIEYDTVGTYEYKIKELDDGIAGYTYDTTEYTLTVVVTLPNPVGDYVATATYSGGSSASRAEFTNIFDIPYESKAAIVAFEAFKKVEGDTPQQDGTFRFALKAEGKAPMAGSEELLVKEIKGAGVIDFGKIDYTEVGTYIYTITEQDLNEEGYVYDTSIYKVIVEVTLESKWDDYVAKVSYEKAGSEVAEVVFTNTYKAKEVEKPAVAAATGDANSMVTIVAVMTLAAVVIVISAKKKVNR